MRGGGCLRGMGKSELGWCPPNPENPASIMGSVWAEVKEEMRLGNGQQPCLIGVPSCALSSGPATWETPQPVLSLCTRWPEELKRQCNINVAARFIKCPNKLLSQAHSVLFTAAIISPTLRLI